MGRLFIAKRSCRVHTVDRSSGTRVCCESALNHWVRGRKIVHTVRGVFTVVCA